PRGEPVAALLERLAREEQLLRRLQGPGPGSALRAKARPHEHGLGRPPAFVGVEVHGLVPVVPEERLGDDRASARAELGAEEEALPVARDDDRGATPRPSYRNRPRTRAGPARRRAPRGASGRVPLDELERPAPRVLRRVGEFLLLAVEEAV